MHGYPAPHKSHVREHDTQAAVFACTGGAAWYPEMLCSNLSFYCAFKVFQEKTWGKKRNKQHKISENSNQNVSLFRANHVSFPLSFRSNALLSYHTNVQMVGLVYSQLNEELKKKEPAGIMCSAII